MKKTIKSKDTNSRESKNRLGLFKPILAGLIAFAAFSCFFRLAKINGNSMNDTYFDGNTAIVYKYGVVERGDIIVCDCDDIGKNLIKRVIAVGGDEIDIDFETGTVTLNGDILSEDYIKEPTFTDEGGFEYPVTVPEGHFFVMGDNRNNSTDSRDARGGFVPLEDIEGKVLFKLPSF